MISCVANERLCPDGFCPPEALGHAITADGQVLKLMTVVQRNHATTVIDVTSAVETLERF